MSKPFSNNPHKDPDRREIWQILMTEDFEGYCAANFSKCKRRFDKDFCGYNGNFSPNPDDWKLAFPTLAPYEKMWIESARDSAKKRPKNETWLEFFDRSVKLDVIDIAGCRALARKKFLGATTMQDGSEFKMDWQTHYWLRKRPDGWKITGFLGYLPFGGR